MLWLIYGGRGWIGSQIVQLLKDLNENVIVGSSRIDNYETTKSEIETTKPDRIICTTGRTSGPGFSNIDYLEQPGKIIENLRDNLQGPLNLAQICQKLGIHMTYMGTGCIFEYDDKHPMSSGIGFTEQDSPNFKDSQYSAVKGVTDSLIRNFDMVLNLRIRMPISNQVNPRNFITKITQYKKVISIPNSMTVLEELLPILIDLAKNQITGTLNFTNPGAISHAEILDMYKEIVNPNFEYEVMDLEELKKYTSGRRSNNYLETDLLQQLYPDIKKIHEAVRQSLIEMKINSFSFGH